MAAQNRHQGDDERVGGVALSDRRQADTERDARVAELEAALDRKDDQLQALIDQYEHVLATRDRLRREAGESEFVWTEDSPSTTALLDRLR
jgi:hypothetical protein